MRILPSSYCTRRIPRRLTRSGRRAAGQNLVRLARRGVHVDLQHRNCVNVGENAGGGYTSVLLRLVEDYAIRIAKCEVRGVFTEECRLRFVILLHRVVRRVEPVEGTAQSKGIVGAEDRQEEDYEDELHELVVTIAIQSNDCK